MKEAEENFRLNYSQNGDDIVFQVCVSRSFYIYIFNQFEWEYCKLHFRICIA